MTDFYDIKGLLTEDERMVLDMTRKFAKKEIPNKFMAECFEKDRFPTELIPALANDLMCLGIKTNPAYGGSGLSNMIYGLVCQELEKADSGIRSFVSVQNSLCMFPIEQFGSEEQKKYWLPLMTAGKKIGCFGLTEPDFGSNPAGLRTTAIKKGNEFVLNGAKMWITNGTIADVAIIWAKTNPKDTTGESIKGFLVEKDTRGFYSRPMKHKWSLRASDTAELILNNVVIPETNLLPGTNAGIKTALACLTQARYGIAWGAVGAAMACYECALDYAKSRIQFHGKPIASHQLIQADLVEMITKITKAQLLIWRLAKLMDEKGIDKTRHIQVSMAKMDNVKMAMEIARSARNLLGANGISLEYPVVRHMANLESVFTYEGTDNIHKLSIGRHITGLNAF
ncbi:acyl-CoA dehydrogenase family protein [Patescibacteria group bacterium]|nr:acyl-CoA dehydrogenase family protein [Patescibacteria group bacterium]